MSLNRVACIKSDSSVGVNMMLDFVKITVQKDIVFRQIQVRAQMFEHLAENLLEVVLGTMIFFPFLYLFR